MITKKSGRGGNSPAGAVLRFLGTFLLIGLILACLPLTVPRLFGYHIYSVVSGSMEPAIPGVWCTSGRSSPRRWRREK